jgi:hypothetical protein
MEKSTKTGILTEDRIEVFTGNLDRRYFFARKFTG